MTKGPRRMSSLRRSNSLSLRGFPLKFQYPTTRCLQSQSLVTPKMFDTLEVSQDFMWAMGRHRNVLAADATVGVARFASCICSSSDEEPTDFICPHTFFILNVRLDRIRRRGWPASDSSALVSLLSATCGPGGAALCPKCWRTASTSVNRKYSEEKKDTRVMKYLVRY